MKSATQSRLRDRADLPPGIRFEILARDNFTCQACDARPGNDQLHIDHLLPWSRGGSHDTDNLATLCKPCNLGKGARIYVPSRLLASPTDDAGFSVWRSFGAWRLEVCDGGMLANWPADRFETTWIGIERCWEDDWVEHFGWKSNHRGHDDVCRIGGQDKCSLDDLDAVLRFMRRIYRRGGAR